jgi:hypothetical protein
MADRIQYYLDGTVANPKNSRDINFVLDFRDRTSQLEMDVQNLVFVGEDYSLIENHLNQFGRGIGLPLDVQFTNGQTIRYFIDFNDPSFTKSERSFSCPVKLRKGYDHFFKLADGLTFTNTSKINWQAPDFTLIDYVVIPTEQMAYFISLSLAAYSLTREAITAVLEATKAINELINASTPVVPVGVDVGDIIWAALNVLARIIWLAAIIIALIKLIKEILNIIFPKIRQFKGVTVKRLIEKGCNALGFTFESTLLDSLPFMTILPVPLAPKTGTFFQTLLDINTQGYTEGFPTSKDTIRTLGETITAFEDIFYAETKVYDGVVRLELESYFEQQSTGNLKLAYNLQEQLQNEHSFNSDEIFKRKVIQYEIDPNDFNTMDDTAFKIAEYDTSSPINPYGDDMELWAGYDEVQIPFAPGTPKGGLTFVENAAKVLAQVVDVFTGGNLSAQIASRKNVLQLSEQYFSKTKLLYMNGSRLNQNQNNFIGADKIAVYHNDSFVENKQKDVYTGMPLPTFEDELFNLIQNNFITLNDGRKIKVERVAWNERRAKADVDYTIKAANINAVTTEINAG